MADAIVDYHVDELILGDMQINGVSKLPHPSAEKQRAYRRLSTAGRLPIEQ